MRNTRYYNSNKTDRAIILDEAGIADSNRIQVSYRRVDGVYRFEVWVPVKVFKKEAMTLYRKDSHYGTRANYRKRLDKVCEGKGYYWGIELTKGTYDK